MRNYESFFRDITGYAPYQYQCRLACGEARADGAWLEGGVGCESRLISIPTGLGKTAAVTLAWLWNRIVLGNETWPRRLVYCLPMRTLVEQTSDEISHWLSELAKAVPSNKDVQWLAERSPIILMGGADNDPKRREWDIYPEKPAIIIGTQDMLLSRALNRGYGMARARWPMHFALLNNDSLWVMDETQLMDVGLATSAQLQSFRNPDAHTWWMSATLQPDWLRSPETESLLPTWSANVLTTKPPEGITKTLVLQTTQDAKGIADLAKTATESQSVTFTALVILNSVKRATEVYEALAKDKALASRVDLHLVHSRFRSADRQAWRSAFLSRQASTTRPRIIVATQVVEAGVDISADALITELAPWTSLVQRFGRAARYGGAAVVTVLDLEEKQAPPYDYPELEAAREELRQLTDVSVASLANHEATLSPERRAALYPYAPPFLLLQREIDELFDTSADLSGADLDVSRFIRFGVESDCQIGWIETSPKTDYQPAAAELCAVPIGAAKEFVAEHKGYVWRWDYLDHTWRLANQEDIYPGLTLLALASVGGYTTKHGFNHKSTQAVPTLPPLVVDHTIADAAEENECLSETRWQTIAEHGAQTVAQLRQIGLNTGAVLELAARWHDLGKAHPAFQSLISNASSGDIAKAPPDAWQNPPKYRTSETDLRPGFRHELASALALLDLRLNHAQFAELTQAEFDLFLYLVAAHHGKVRAAMQASPFDQEHPVAKTGAELPIRGVLDGDTIQGAPFGFPDMTLTLSPATLGYSPKTGASWTERVLALLATHTAFRLALLETLLRAADARASK